MHSKHVGINVQTMKIQYIPQENIRIMCQLPFHRHRRKHLR